MPFTKRFDAECIPEWRKAYIDYKSLRALVYTIEKQHTSSILRNNIAARPGSATSYINSPPTQLSDVVARDIETERTQLSNASNREEQLSQDDLGFLYNLLTHGTEQEKMFFDMLDQQLDKVSKFFNEREHDARSKFTALQIQMKLVSDYGQLLKEDEETNVSETSPLLRQHHPDNLHDNDTTWSPFLDKKHHQLDYQVARGRLKKAMTEFYHSLQYLQSFKDLNMQAFQKILKKFDRAAGWKAGSVYMKKVKQHHWSTCNDVERMIEKTEELYTTSFSHGNRRKAVQALKIYQTIEAHTSAAWRVGLYLGACIILLIHTAYLAWDPEISQRIPHMATHLQIYAAFSLPILFALGFSVNMLVWTRCRINYKFIFELDPSDNLDYHQFAELPALFLLLLSIAMYFDFSQSLEPAISCQSWPMILFVTILCICICPFNIFYRSARKWLAVTLGRIILSYLFPVEFPDFFIADELNSLAYSFWTITYFFCAYSCNWTGLDEHCYVTHMWITPFLAALPPWWRFLQCIRRYQDSRERVHVINAIKYTTSIAATFATAIRRMKPTPGMDVVWILCSMINSSYTSIWDIKMDWGLLVTESKHFLLRDDLVFPVPVYYVCAVLNVALRFAWALNTAGLTLQSDVLGYLTAVMEACRRLQWNFFRLENEHLSNCADYRAINEIPLPFSPPEDMKQQEEQLLSPVSEEEGSIEWPTQRPSRRMQHQQLQRQYTWAHTINPTVPTQVGSFYGRRDFEGKREAKKLPFRYAGIGRYSPSRKSSANSSSDEDDDEEDDEDDNAETMNVSPRQ